MVHVNILQLSSRSTNYLNIQQYAVDVCKTVQTCRLTGSTGNTRVRSSNTPRCIFSYPQSYPQTHLLSSPDASAVIPRCIFCYPQMHLLLPPDAASIIIIPRCSFCLSHSPHLPLGVQNPKPKTDTHHCWYADCPNRISYTKLPSTIHT